MARENNLGAWGVGVFENDAASDWFGLFEKLGFLAVITPLTTIGEYSGMKKPIPAETEQTFWAMCEVIAIAAGLSTDCAESVRDAQIAKEANMIMRIPNLKQRVLIASERLKVRAGELENLWEGAGEGDAFRESRSRTMRRMNEALGI